MKKGWSCILLAAAGLLLMVPGVPAAEAPAPFGFHIGATHYAEAIDLLRAKDWPYREYSQKGFKEIGGNAKERGQHTFLVVKCRKLEGVMGIRLFFSPEAMLDAMIVVLQPRMFPVVMDELDGKYKAVKKNLYGESFSTNYTHALWEKGAFYIELQKLSEHHVRLVYVSKLLYENYKDFLHTAYESFRKQQGKEAWMDEL